MLLLFICEMVCCNADELQVIHYLFFLTNVERIYYFTTHLCIAILLD